MRKKIYSLLLGLGAAVFLMLPASPALAVDVLSPACEDNPGAAACQGNTNQASTGNSIYGPNGVLTRAASLFAVAVGIAAVIMVIIGGYKYVLASGDPTNIKSAKDTIMYALAGLLVAAGAQGIVVFVLNRL